MKRFRFMTEVGMSRRFYSAAVLVCAAAAALAAFVVAQGYEIGILRFVTPLHHDDFSALAGGPGFDLHLPRPISSNFIYMLGYYGGPFYFLVYACLNALALALTVCFAYRMYSVKMSPWVLCCTVFLVSLSWLYTRPSVYSFQYLGLSTNLVSYIFAVLAVMVLQGGGVPFHLRTVAFTALCILTAFAKEDMVLFMLLAVSIRVADDATRGRSVHKAVKHNVALFAIVLAAYVGSVLHSKLVGSAFTAGSGAYDVSHPLGNLLQNAVAFWTASPAMKVVLSASILLIVLSVARYAVLRSAASLRDFMVSLLPLAAALPYLLLPRFVDYYAISFVPMILAFVGPGLATLASVKSRNVLAAVVLLFPVSASAFFHQIDQQLMHWGMGWYLEHRDTSERQISAIAVNFSSELRQCDTIAVTGLSDPLGPFANNGSTYVNRVLGVAKSWRISALPGTSLAQFVATLPPKDPKWVYVASDAEALSVSGCALAFDKAGNGTFRRLTAAQ